MSNLSARSPVLHVRTGCSFAYEVAQPVALLLNLKPRRNPEVSLEQEQLLMGPGIPAEEFEDEHGNLVYRLELAPGVNRIRHDAIFAVSPHPENHEFGRGQAVPLAELPVELMKYTLPSRYCDSDKMLSFAWNQFGAIERGQGQVEAVCDWINANIEYRFGSGSPELSAWDVLQRKFGVCRDFAHLTVALCRALNLPARYVTGHVPDIGHVDPSPMDFHAYAEVYLSGRWYTYDARYNEPRIGRIKVSCGRDAVDCAFATAYGPAKLSAFEVWAYQIAPGSAQVGGAIDLSQRLDGSLEIRGLPAA